LEGTCSGDYQSVKDLFASHLKTGKDENAQLCVFADGKCVVDLWGSSINDRNYGPDNLQLIFSSGKSVASFVVALMVERNLLDYEEKVTKYWPEFATGQGQGEKEDLTLADVLRHEAGLDNFDDQIGVEDCLPESIRANDRGKIIEASSCHFPENTLNKDGSKSKRTYHAMTRGMILNEIVRRVDEQGRTMGQILREDVGIPGIRCGLTTDELAQVAPQKIPSIWQFIKDNVSGRGYMTFKELVFFVFTLIFVMAPKALFKKSRPLFREPIKDFYGFMSDETLRRGEAFSFNCHGTARGLALLASVLANKGAAAPSSAAPESAASNNKNKRLISEETWQKMHANYKKSADSALFGMVTNFSQGGVNAFPNPKSDKASLMFRQRAGYVGWMGLGGSVFQWHPELKIGFAYVPSLLQTLDFANTRGAYLQAEVKKCAELIHKNM